MAKVFIAGAGYVGTVAAGLLAQAGHTVDIGRRTARDEPGSHAMDVLRPATYPAALREASCVVYCVSADGFTPESYRDAYVEGLARVTEAASQGAAKRLIFVSSTGVYGQDDGSVVDENSPAEPRGFSGRTILEGEALLAAASIESAAIRFSGIYGPGRDRLIRMVRTHAPVSAKTRCAITNRIHRDDCARALVHLVGQSTVAPLYLGSDEAPTPMGEILDWIAARLGVDPPPPGEVAGDAPQRGGNKRISSARLRGEGFRFLYPTYREGFGALLAASD
ncbi:MAG: NAD-dependent epimerase/dehydratase family protein [Betaproteobacteria bacterium]|nr:NAD-dependent epimerase/dehydratase family protein [Betaproteobacteria bacterium]